MKYPAIFSFIILVSAIFIGCEKDVKSINPEGGEIYSEFRSELDSSILWLEEFRLNLIDTNRVFSYSVSEVEYGVETVYNLLGSVGPKLTSNAHIYKDSFQVQTENGSLDGEQIKLLSSKVFYIIKDYVIEDDKGFLFVNINSDVNGGLANFDIEITASSISEPDTSASLRSFCTENYFSASDCYRSAVGNPKKGFPIYGGGPCGDINDETSAQLEIEAAIQDNIPRVIYHGVPGWSLEKAIIRYTNPVTEYLEFKVDLSGLSETYENCQQLKLDYKDKSNVLSEIEYESDRLNCTLCILQDYIESIRPSGKKLCDITIWGDLLIPSSGGEIHWFANVVFCDAEVLQLQLPLPPGIADPEDFLGNVSIIDLY